MRITYLKLENFAGVYAGMGLNSLELDMSNPNLLNMFVGDNGSGKSVALSQLTPFRESNDNRKKLIIGGKLGYKEIHIEDGKNLYEIKHYYGEKSKDNKSYITKNGEELNENGGIKTFNTTLEKEFNLTTEYLKIGKLGAGLDTFIKLTSSDRKKFIGNFIPNIDDMLTAFENAKANFSAVNKELKKLESSIEKIGSIEILEETKNTLDKELENLNIKKEKLSNVIAIFNTNINNLLGDYDESSIKDKEKELHKELDRINKEVPNIMTTLKALYTRYPNLQNYDYNKIIDTENVTNTDKLLKEQEISMNQEKKNNIITKLVEVTDKINKTACLEINEEDYEKYKSMQKDLIEEKEGRVKELDKISEYANNRDLENLINERNNIMDEYKALEGVSERYDVDKYTDEPKKFKDIDNLSNRIELNKIKYNEINDKIKTLKANEKMMDILDKRPIDCKINTCPFIANALSVKEEMKQLEALYNELDRLNKDIADDEDLIEEHSIFNSYIKEVNDISKEYYSSIENAYKVFDILEKENISNLYKGELDTINKYILYVSIDKDIHEINTKLDSVNSKLETYETQITLNNKIKEEYNDMVKESERYNKELEDIDSIINNLHIIVKKDEAKLGILFKLKNSLKDIDENKEKYTKVSNEHENITDRMNKIKELKHELKDLESEFKSIKFETEKFKKNSEEAGYKMREAIQLKESYDKLCEDYHKYEAVKKALDPKEGMPIVKIGNYLDDIEIRANNLLDIAYDGKFQIRFNISEKDFFIQVYKSDGTMLNDIKEASEGELSMTTVCLSFALIEKAIDKYNIIYLDEADATLSTENRRKFISIITEMADKLGIEQVFIISHNNEFNAYPMNLFLFRGAESSIDIEDNEFMENKKVLFKY